MIFIYLLLVFLCIITDVYQSYGRFQILSRSKTLEFLQNLHDV